MSRFSRFKRFLFKFNLIPTHKWRLPATILMAFIFGLGFYILKLSNATSYLSDDPQACVNCHVMTPQYLTWKHSSHREVASCNDCHVPHDFAANKYFFKAKDGLGHAFAYTFRLEPEVIRAKEASIEVIQNNCIRCHEKKVTDAKLSGSVEMHFEHRTDRLCWECHREVPHGRVKSLSSVGHQIEPLRAYSEEDKSVVPKWLQAEINKTENNTNKN